LVLNGISGAEPAHERRAGFLEKVAELKEQGVVDYEITERTANWKRTEGRSIMDGLLALGRHFDGIFAANDMMALGVVEAYRQAPEHELPLVVGFDAIDDARQAVKEKKFIATMAQDPYEMGKRGVEFAYKVLQGESVEKDTYIAVKAVHNEELCP